MIDPAEIESHHQQVCLNTKRPSQFATQCLQTSTDDCSCFNLPTFQEDFPKSISTKFFQAMAFSSPSDTSFCFLANEEACSFYQRNESCCCQGTGDHHMIRNKFTSLYLETNSAAPAETSAYRTCHINMIVNEEIPFASPCQDTCELASQASGSEGGAGAGGKVVLYLFLIFAVGAGCYFYYRRRRQRIFEENDESKRKSEVVESQDKNDIQQETFWTRLKHKFFHDESLEPDIEAGTSERKYRAKALASSAFDSLKAMCNRISAQRDPEHVEPKPQCPTGESSNHSSLSSSSSDSSLSSSSLSSSSSSLSSSSSDCDIVSVAPKSGAHRLDHSSPDYLKGFQDMQTPSTEQKTTSVTVAPQTSLVNGREASMKAGPEAVELARIRQLEQEKIALQQMLQAKERQAIALQSATRKNADRIQALETHNEELQKTLHETSTKNEGSRASLSIDELHGSSSPSLDFLEAHRSLRKEKKGRSSSTSKSFQASLRELQRQREQRKIRKSSVGNSPSRGQSKLEELCTQWQQCEPVSSRLA